MSQPFQLPLEGLHLIEASAGTGKTWTLMVLYLRQVLERQRMPDSILAVTFTNASAAELRRRIRAVLSDAEATLRAGQPVSVTGITDEDLLAALLKHYVDDEERHAKRSLLRAALSGFDRARIETIHGFCQRVLSDLAFGTGTDYASTLSEDSESSRRAWLRHWFQARMDREPVMLASRLHKRFVVPGRPGTFELKYLDELARLADARPEDLTARPSSRKNPDFSVAWSVYSEAASHWSRQWRHDREDVLMQVGASKVGFKSKVHRSDSVTKAFAAWDEWSIDGEVPKWLERFTPEVLATAWKGDAEFREIACWQAAARLVDAATELALTTAELEINLQQDLIEAARQELRQERIHRGELSFDDLLQNLRSATANPEFTRRLAAQLPVMLIDEFQDTDPVQWTIFSQIFNAGSDAQSLYLVGDPKQAIYSFRNADLHTYLHAASSDGITTHRLQTNYRSQPVLVDAINQLYKAQDLPFVLPEVSFHPVAAGRRTGLDLTGAPLTLRWIDRPGEKVMSSEVIGRAVVEDVADEIHRMIETQDLSADRIAVLVRRKEEGRWVAAALRRYGVPAVIADQEPLFQTPVAGEIVLVLRALLHEDNRAALVAAMGTQLLGYTADEIRRLESDESFFSMLRRDVRLWRQIWRRWGAFPLLQRIIKERQVPGRILAAPDGARLLTNLRHLMEILHAEQRRWATSPAALLAWFEERIRRDQLGERRLATEAAAVEVVTMHKAKGLQWDVVFCPFLWSEKVRDAKDLLRFHHPDHGLTVQLMASPVSEAEQEAQAEAKGYSAVETEAEQARLLYVALTRARERCIVHLGASSGMAKKSAYAFFAPGYAPAALAKMTDEQMANALLRVPERIVVERRDHPERLRRTLPSPVDSAPSVDPVRQQHRAPATPWRRLSYSGLARTLALNSHEAPLSLRDESPDVPLAAFPRGARVGDFFHYLFEHHLRGPLDLDVLQERLRSHGLSDSIEPASLARVFDQLRRTPIAEGYSLTELTTDGQLPEASFLLPLASGFRPRDLSDAILKNGSPFWVDYGRQLKGLEEDRVAGFLTGSIDLVYCHQQKWGLVDYKSNHLGEQREDYGDDAMLSVMMSHHYLLQGLIYSVALLRMIRRRDPKSDPFEAFGGARFLFIRGADQPGYGVFQLPTERALLLALDRCFAGVTTP